MEMTRFEKWFVNAPGHSAVIARDAVVRLEPFVPRLPGHVRYLDVGCGNGQATLAVARAFGWEVTGVDVDAAQIALAERARAGDPRARFQTADARTLPFEQASFEVVAARMVLHHVLRGGTGASRAASKSRGSHHEAREANRSAVLGFSVCRPA